MTEPTMNEDQNPLTKPKFIISAVVVAIIVALGIILALPKGEGTPTAEPTNTGTTTPSAQPSSTTDASICGLPSGDQAKPATTPADTKWELIGKIAAPTSPTQFGPGKTEANGLRSCFAHSPTGALYAGANIVILASSGHNDLVLRYLTVDSPERDKLLNSSSASGSPGAPSFQLAGFKVTDYSGDRAVIEYGFKVSNGTFGSLPVVMQWSDGDWKAVPPASGQPEGKQLADLGGFIPWEGV
ncbi:hypothetical protein FJ661_20070 [Pseudarthrobacter phenanthrenivorans]|uniref:hypothetical protein n=1 Tax=Pseudarthrobacter phenanthrenivorans TaxID=361575 RepID=UPI00112CCC86|nr:hypothetical protein [Pseudarthrobacter phenanthrenivorans]TPV47817.1 hypothetical protein FJ661_20070 [Pseudarthrobacter phenanthrenivorans]